MHQTLEDFVIGNGGSVPQHPLRGSLESLIQQRNQSGAGPTSTLHLSESGGFRASRLPGGIGAGKLTAIVAGVGLTAALGYHLLRPKSESQVPWTERIEAERAARGQSAGRGD